MFIINYLIALGVFLGLDKVWLSFIAKKVYKEQLGFLLKKKANLAAAVFFYLLFINGLMIFVINPANSWDEALLGAFFGLITYATYDLTNLATIKKWPLKITLIDLVWGTSLNALTAVITYALKF